MTTINFSSGTPPGPAFARGSRVDPGGPALAIFDQHRGSAQAGVANTGDLINGLASEVNWRTFAFVLKPGPLGTSRQASQMVLLKSANRGPKIVLDQSNAGRVDFKDTGDHAATGDMVNIAADEPMSLKVWPTLADLTPAANGALLSQWNGIGNNRAWNFRLNTDGTLSLVVSSDGTAGNTSTATSSVSIDATMRGFMVEIDQDANTVDFYYTTDNIGFGATWQALGTQITSFTRTIYTGSTNDVMIGSIIAGSNDNWVGSLYRAEISFGGVIVAAPEFDKMTPNSTTLLDEYDNTWTVTGTVLPFSTTCVYDPVTITGTSVDADGTDTVEITLVRDYDGQYWTGTEYQEAAISQEATLAGTSDITDGDDFSLAVGVGAFLTAGTYTLTIVATDLGSPVLTSTLVRELCVDGATALGFTREAILGDGHDIVVKVVGRYGGVAPGVIVAELPVTSTVGQFDRRVDETSEADITVNLSGIDLQRMCDDIADIETYAHELVIYWKGKIAWTGPITYVRHFKDGVQIKAADLTVHWETRVLGTHIHENEELATIFADYHRDAYQQDPWGITVIAKPVGVTGTREVLESQGMLASRAIDELARTGLDWTAYGRQILIGGGEIDTPTIITLTDEHFSEPLEVVDDGVLRATDVVVGGDGVSGRATESQLSDRYRRYGLITARNQELSIEDVGSANQAARTRLDFYRDPLRIDTGSGVLKPSAPVDLTDLIPGTRISLSTSAACRTVSGTFRLAKVVVAMNGTVKIELQPLGTVVATL